MSGEAAAFTFGAGAKTGQVGGKLHRSRDIIDRAGRNKSKGLVLTVDMAYGRTLARPVKKRPISKENFSDVHTVSCRQSAS